MSRFAISPGADLGLSFAARWRRHRRKALLAGAACCAVISLAIIGFIVSVRVPSALLADSPPSTLILLDIRGGILADIGNAQARSQRPIALSEMGPYLPRITMALEDQRFLAHGGIDWHTLIGAMWRNARNGRIISGASTITEQLVKLSASGAQPRGWLAKAREAIAAWKLERRFTKGQILARYLNTISYGNRLLGPEAAARAYFNKPAAELSMPEAIYLAGLPQAPSRFNPWRHPQAAADKYQRDLHRLRALGILSVEEAERFANAPPLVGPYLAARRAPHFVDAVLQQIQSHDPKSQISNFKSAVLGGTVRTTLDPEMQQTAERLLSDHLRSLGNRNFAQAAMVVIENSSGAVRALVGSSDYYGARGQNNAALMGRSAGSTLKPFLYLHAIDRRLLTAASLLPDTAEAVREVYADYNPQNYSRLHVGPVRVRQALGNSLNVPAVVALSRVGARQMFYDLSRWGLHLPQSFDDCGAGFILGSVDVRLLDLTGAYASLARGGLALPPRLLATGPAVSAERVASPEAASIVADMLCDPDARRITFRPDSPLNCPQRIAVKTGTSSNFRDGWCMGFTGRHTVGVWTGNLDNQPMQELLAVRSAAPLWRGMINHLMDERYDPRVPAPTTNERLTQREICPLTGLTPSRGSPPAVAEYFLSGTEPTAAAATMFAEDAPAAPGAAPRLRLPAEYAAWCASPQNAIGAVAESNRPLAIVSPPDGASYLIDPELGAGQQMLELVSNAANPSQVSWTINGQPLATRNDHRNLWPLTRGHWQISATSAADANGRPPQQVSRAFDVE